MSSKQQLSVQLAAIDKPNYKSILKSNVYIKSKLNLDFKEVYQNIPKNGKYKFRDFFNAGKRYYVDGMPELKVQSSNTKYNLRDDIENNLIAYLNTINNTSSILSENVRARVATFEDRVHYLLTDVDNIVNNTNFSSITGISAYLNDGYSYSYLPYNNKIVLTKDTDIKIFTAENKALTVLYTNEDTEGITHYYQEQHSYVVDDGYEGDEVTTVELTEEEYYYWLGYDDDISFVFINKSIVPYETIRFDIDYNTNIPITTSTCINSEAINAVYYKYSNIQKLEFYSDPTYSEIEIGNTNYKLFNSAWNTFHTYPIVMLRYRTYNLYDIYKENKDNMKVSDWNVEGAYGIFTPRRYKTTKKILKTLDLKLKDLTESFIYKEGKEKNGPAEGIDKTTSLFLFLGLSLADVEEKLNGETIEIGGQEKVLKPDKNAQVIIKTIFKTIEMLADPNTEQDNITFVIDETMYHYSLSFSVYKEVTTINNKKKPYYKLIKDNNAQGSFKIYEVKGKTKTTYTVSAVPGTRFNTTGSSLEITHEIRLDNKGNNDPTDDEVVYEKGHILYTHSFFDYEHHGKRSADIYFPLIKEVVDNLSIQDQCKLMTYCTQVQILLSYRQKLKWYQTFETRLILQALTSVLYVATVAYGGIQYGPFFALLVAALSVTGAIITDSKMSARNKSIFGLFFTAIQIAMMDYSSLAQISIQSALTASNMALEMFNTIYSMITGSNLETKQKNLEAKLERLENVTEYSSYLRDLQNGNRYIRDIVLNIDPSGIYAMNTLCFDYDIYYTAWIQTYCDDSLALWYK